MNRPAGPPAAVVARLRAAGCVFAEDEARLLLEAARTPEHLARLVRERVEGAPLEHVLGWVGFAGLRLAVGPGVFVPRARTQALLSEAEALLRASPAPAVVVDLCCGCGAVGAGLLAALGERVELHAVDVDPAAVACARTNLEPRGGAVHEGDLYAPLPPRLRGRVQLVVANAPYVPSGAILLMPREARLHEPRAALDGGADGLDVQRRVAAGAGAWLADGGHVAVETSREQAGRTAALLATAGLRTRTARSEELDATVVVGTRERVSRR